MVNRWQLTIALLLTALAAWGAEQKYYRYPATTAVHDASRVLIYEVYSSYSGSRNITGASLKAVLTNRSTAWDSITGKPAAFAPAGHSLNHVLGGSDPVFMTIPQIDGLSDALAGKVGSTDPRLSDARTPLAHNQAASTITGLATVATSGSYNDLFSRPTIPAACVDVFDGAPGADSTVPGPPGKTVLNGTSDPIASDGTDGDFFLNTVTATLFGPKAAGAWGTGISLVGPPGEQGPPGPPGTVDQPTILGVIATPTDGALLEVQQGPSEAGTVPKLGVSDTSGNLTFYVDGAGTLTVKKLVIQ